MDGKRTEIIHATQNGKKYRIVFTEHGTLSPLGNTVAVYSESGATVLEPYLPFPHQPNDEASLLEYGKEIAEKRSTQF